MNPIIAFIKLIRLPNLLIIALTQYAVRYLLVKNALTQNLITDINVDLQLSDISFFMLSLSTVMIAAAGYIINDYFDRKTDRINKPELVIVGKYIKRRVAMGAHIVINVLAIILGAYVAYQAGNIKLLSIQILSIAGLWYYSTTFKKQVLIGNIIVAILAGIVPLIAGLYDILMLLVDPDNVVNRMLFNFDPDTPFEKIMRYFKYTISETIQYLLGFSIFAFLTTMVREIVKDMEDIEGDEQSYIYTLPVVYGKSIAKMISYFFIFIIVGLLAYFQYKLISGNMNIIERSRNLISIMYLLFTVQIPFLYVAYRLFVATEKKDFSHLSLIVKIIMLAGISYIFVYSYLLIMF